MDSWWLVRLSDEAPPACPPQVMLGSDVEAALIQYATNAEARRAISSTEAVLNNRFIKVYWHHDGGKQPGQVARGPSRPLGQKTTNISKVCMDARANAHMQ